MQISSAILTSAKRWGEKKLASSARVGERFTRVDDVVDLLAESTSPAAQPGARILLNQMATRPWSVIRGAHLTTEDDQESEPKKGDTSLHVTIAIADDRYHLRLDAQSAVFDITRRKKSETLRPAGRKPWVGPGA